MALTVFAVGVGLRAADQTPFDSLAKLASALSENDSDDALEYFDAHMQSYGQIEQKLEALTAQQSRSRPRRDRAFMEIAELAQRCADFVEEHARPGVAKLQPEASHAAD